jgi:hypothetical protein
MRRPSLDLVLNLCILFLAVLAYSAAAQQSGMEII